MSNTDSSESLSSSWMAVNQKFSFPTDDDNRLAALEMHWNRATQGIMMKNRWFHDKLVPLYSEPIRFYHTLVHLEEMLGYLECMNDLSQTKQDEQVLILTIFFHDAIYDATSATNEEDSAKLFEEFWNECSGQENDNEAKTRVIRYILATKQHTATEDDACAQLLLDIDMAVLGKQKEAYWKYAGLIRNEYDFVEHDVFCEKRAEVLKGFLEHDIFGTPAMKNALEEQARENLKAEIESLEKGCIPGEDDS